LLFILLYSRESDEKWWQSIVIGIVGGFAISIRSMGIVICLALVFDGLQRWWQVRKGIRTESLIAAVKHPILVAVSALGFLPPNQQRAFLSSWRCNSVSKHIYVGQFNGDIRPQRGVLLPGRRKFLDAKKRRVYALLEGAWRRGTFAFIGGNASKISEGFLLEGCARFTVHGRFC
jgi:hypothetical protein